MPSFLQRTVAGFFTAITARKTCRAAWTEAGPTRRALTLSWSMAKVLQVAGSGSFPKVAVVLRLPPTDDAETVGGVMRAVVTEWLDDYGKAHLLATISEAIQELNNRMLGNADAQYNIGTMYFYGKGVSQDYVEAMRWYRMAADQGDSSAQNHIGSLYRNGWGITQDVQISQQILPEDVIIGPGQPALVRVVDHIARVVPYTSAAFSGNPSNFNGNIISPPPLGLPVGSAPRAPGLASPPHGPSDWYGLAAAGTYHPIY